MSMVLPPAVLLLVAGAAAAPRKHTVALGQWHTVKAHATSGDAGTVRVRQLWIDEQLKEYTVGLAHSVTDRVFVIRRAYRVNDALPESAPQEKKEKRPGWVWRLGGWLSVNRYTGRLMQLNLPAFDETNSEVSWYRDYAAYCGTSEDGGKAYLVIWQLGKRKPLLRREFSGSGCPAPRWQRDPSRVTFLAGGETNTFVVDPPGAGLTETDDLELPR
jgi:hypothetical protein